MGEKKKVEIEVNILTDDGVVKEKTTYDTDTTDYVSNGTKLGSIKDKELTDNGQPSYDKQPLDDNQSDRQNWGVRSFFKTLCFSGRSKKAERQKRIQKILLSINSIEGNLNYIPGENCKSRCNKKMIEIIFLGIAILIVAAIFMIPVPLYYSEPPHSEIDENMSNFFKTCQSPVCCVYII